MRVVHTVRAFRPRSAVLVALSGVAIALVGVASAPIWPPVAAEAMRSVVDVFRCRVVKERSARWPGPAMRCWAVEVNIRQTFFSRQ